MDGNISRKTYLSNLGARITIARKELGMSQAKLAEAIGLSVRAYQSYEMGQRSIPIEALVEMHQKFNVDLNWILLGAKAVRMQHDIAALEEFEVKFDQYLNDQKIRIASEKRGIIVSLWYQSHVEGREVPFEQVHTWIELVGEPIKPD